MAWFAVIDSRIGRREFGRGDLLLTREEAERVLAEVLRASRTLSRS